MTSNVIQHKFISKNMLVSFYTIAFNFDAKPSLPVPNIDILSMAFHIRDQPFLHEHANDFDISKQTVYTTILPFYPVTFRWRILEYDISNVEKFVPIAGQKCHL